MNDIEAARLIAEKVKEKGGETYFVGGCVRDRLMGRSGGDIDVEVHGVEVDTLCAILDGIGNRIGMGESFGIFTLAGLSLDIAMPRKERATGKGHRDLETSVDPFAGVQAAAKRRDFTVNAIMENVLTGEISDPYGGIEDVKKKVLRHVDGETFGEDPLRVLRAARFAATLGFSIAPETLEICKKTDISALSRERIEGETKKALLGSGKPSVFFNSLKEMGQLGVWFGELNALDGVEQSRKYHPEGDAFVHTMAVVDHAASLRDKAEKPYFFMLSALCHDMGKAVTTEYFGGDWHSYNHEKEGLPIIGDFVSRLSSEKELKKYVLNMAENHMRPNACAAQNAGIKATNRLFGESVCPCDLCLLAEADRLGGDPAYGEFLSSRLGVFEEYMSRPYVTGDDLIANGITDGKLIGEGLKMSYRLRLAGVRKDEALKQILKNVK